MAKDYLKTIKFDSPNKKINCCSTNNFDEEYIKVYPKLNRKREVLLIANYPEYNYQKIKRIICKKYNLKNVVLGSGSEDIVIRINKIAEQEKIKVGFVTPIFHRIIESYKGKNFKFIKHRKLFKSNLRHFGIIWITNPNLFTGEVYNKNNLIKLFRKYSKIIFVIDEAGMFLVENWRKFTLLTVCHSRRNLVLLESFSKMHGLAGLRAGFATGNSKMIEKIENIGLTFPLSTLAEFYISSLLNKNELFEKIRKRIYFHKAELENLLTKNKDVIIKKNLTNCIFLKFVRNSNKYKSLLSKKIYYLNLNSQIGIQEKGILRITTHSSKKIHSKIKKELIDILNLKRDFKPFKVGTLFNPLRKNFLVKHYFRKVEILYPSRLNAMALDPSKIAKNENLQYSPGEIIFKVKIYKKVKVEIIPGNALIIVSEKSRRKPLIIHSALLMKKALNFKNSLFIDVDNQNEIKHAGLGSSSGLISSVACAINELFDNPIKKDDLIRYLAQNHGEEFGSDSNYLSPVQCIGGSAAAGLYDGAMLILAGKSTVIFKMVISNNYKVVIGIPNDFKELDAHMLLGKEIKSFKKFIATGKKYSRIVAYKMIHNVLPAIAVNSLDELGNLIYEYRFKMGSIKNCSYAHNKLPEIAKKLEFLKEEKIADVLSISSVGPAFFVITKKANFCENVFKKNNLKTYIVDLENNKYKVLKRIG